MKYLLTSLVFVLGIYLGTSIIHIPFLSISKEIDIVELGNLVFLIFLSIIIPSFITKKLSNDRVQKDMVIDEIRLFCENLDRVSQILEDCHGKELNRNEFVKILSRLKRSRQNFEVINEQANLLSSKKLEFNLNLVKSSLNEYWTELTGDDGIKPKNFIVKSSFIWKQNTKKSEVTRNARILKFSINNL